MNDDTTRYVFPSQMEIGSTTSGCGDPKSSANYLQMSQRNFNSVTLTIEQVNDCQSPTGSRARVAWSSIRLGSGSMPFMSNPYLLIALQNGHRYIIPFAKVVAHSRCSQVYNSLFKGLLPQEWRRRMLFRDDIGLFKVSSKGSVREGAQMTPVSIGNSPLARLPLAHLDRRAWDKQ